eukprot:203835-Pleurochrysis_carterae.AAC.5
MLKDDARSGGMPQNASGLLAEHIVLSSLDKLKELAGLRSRRVRTFATSRPRSVRPVNRAPLVPSSPSWSPNKPTACNWDRASNLSCTPGGLLASRVSQKGRASWRIRSTGQAPIAILLVGAVRTLVEPRVAASIRTNLIDAQHVAVDVFVHLHLSQDMGTTVDGTWGHAHAIAGGTLDAADDRLRAALERLQPVGRELLENSDCAADALRQHPVCMRLEDERLRGRASMRTPAPKAPLAGFLQYAWVARAFRALMAHEAQRHAPYEWVIRTRPDIAFFDRAPPAIMFPTQRLVLMMKESGPSYFDEWWPGMRNCASDMQAFRILPTACNGCRLVLRTSVAAAELYARPRRLLFAIWRRRCQPSPPPISSGVALLPLAAQGEGHPMELLPAASGAGAQGWRGRLLASPRQHA